MTLQFVFLPYNAWLMVHAAVLSLVRVLFTNAERGLKNSLKGYVIKMKAAAFQALVVVVQNRFFGGSIRSSVCRVGFIAFYSLLDKQRDGLQNRDFKRRGESGT